MAYLSIDGDDFPCEQAQQEQVDEEIGTVRYAFSGAPRSSVRGYRRNWTVRSIPITASDAASWREILQGAPPIAVTGDLAGSVDVVVTDFRSADAGRLIIDGSSVAVVRLSFRMIEA